MIKGIFFDAGGVLYQRGSPTVDFARRLLKTEKYFTIPSEQETLALEALRVHASQGLTGHEAYWQQFLLLHGVQDPERRVNMVRQITDFSNDVQPVPGCREALSGLRSRHFILGIVTDTIYPLEWKMQRLSRAGVSDLIEVVACSSALGVHKPDPAIYMNALHQVNLSPAESAFVGHDAVELNGAHQAGMLTVAVNYGPGVQADIYCRSMLDLLEISPFSINVGDMVANT